jgi:DNA-binding transcriptional MerR regulator
VGERSYLSIGDVLALLRDEFPDITISKIRFLESRGLLVPERTPSGYRKFYDHDVDRLRWILRQQREHFLPLKVIKGRLEGAEGAEGPESLFDSGELPPSTGAEAVEQGHVAASNGRAATRENGSIRSDAGRLATIERHGAGSPADDEHLARASASSLGHTRQGGPALASVPDGGGSRGGRTASHDAHPSSSGHGPSAAEPLAARTAGLPPAESPAPSQPPAGAGAGDAEAAAAGDAATSASAASPEHRVPAAKRPTAAQPPAAAPSGGPATAAPRLDHEPAGSLPAPVPRPDAGHTPGGGGPSPLNDLSGTTLTVSELANASGLSDAQVEELESFGMITGRPVAGVHCYDEEALVVAGLAASFAAFGVEARHLRLFKHAAERQAGLYSQIVMPLLRQRNPAARARALDDLRRLTELGASLQASYSRAALRDLAGG